MLSDLAMEPVDSRHSVTASSTDTTDVQSAVAGVAADSKISRLSRESDLSALTDKEESERTERPKEAVSTVVVETVHSSSQPEIRSKRVGIIYQSSLPERISIHSSKDDKDGVVSILCSLLQYRCSCFLSTRLHVGRLVSACVWRCRCKFACQCSAELGFSLCVVGMFLFGASFLRLVYFS